MKMREIKFRAWDKKRGYFHQGINNICLTLGGNLMWQFGFDAPDFLTKDESKNYILQQYTGVRDKNGKEIYEGDIVQDTYKIRDKVEKITKHIVIWRQETCQFALVPCSCSPYGYFDMTSSERVEIIGNIYENSTLVEGVNND